jgi:predicted Zn-dependent protease
VELDQTDRAREWAKRALEADKDEPAIIYNVACMFAQLEEVDEAITLLE